MGGGGPSGQGSSGQNPCVDLPVSQRFRSGAVRHSPALPGAPWRSSALPASLSNLLAFGSGAPWRSPAPAFGVWERRSPAPAFGVWERRSPALPRRSPALPHTSPLCPPPSSLVQTFVLYSVLRCTLFLLCFVFVYSSLKRLCSVVSSRSAAPSRKAQSIYWSAPTPRKSKDQEI